MLEKTAPGREHQLALLNSLPAGLDRGGKTRKDSEESHFLCLLISHPPAHPDKLDHRLVEIPHLDFCFCKMPRMLRWDGAQAWQCISTYAYQETRNLCHLHRHRSHCQPLHPSIKAPLKRFTGSGKGGNPA